MQPKMSFTAARLMAAASAELTKDRLRDELKRELEDKLEQEASVVEEEAASVRCLCCTPLCVCCRITSPPPPPLPPRSDLGMCALQKQKPAGRKRKKSWRPWGLCRVWARKRRKSCLPLCLTSPTCMRTPCCPDAYGTLCPRVTLCALGAPTPRWSKPSNLMVLASTKRCGRRCLVVVVVIVMHLFCIVFVMLPLILLMPLPLPLPLLLLLVVFPFLVTRAALRVGQ